VDTTGFNPDVWASVSLEVGSIPTPSRQNFPKNQLFLKLI